MKVGLCGLGARLGYLAALFQDSIPDLELVAYADPSPTGLSQLADETARRMRRYDSVQGMMDRESLDLVMIGSPNRFHYDHLSVALAAGSQVFCEKPLVTTEEHTFRLLSQIDACGADRVIVGLVLRYAPLYVDLLRLIEEGMLGEIVSIEASEHIDPAHGAFFFRDWRRKTRLSGGFLLEKCCHDLDLYASLVRSRASRVASFGGRAVFGAGQDRPDPAAVYRQRPPGWDGTDSPFSGDADIVDHQVALIEYESGARLCFHTNMHAPDKFRRFCIVGSEGMAEGDFVRGYLRVHRSLSGKLVFERNYRYGEVSMHYGAERRMVARLAQRFDRGVPLPVSVIECLEAGLTALKIDESRSAGRVVDLSGLWAQFDRQAKASKAVRIAASSEA